MKILSNVTMAGNVSMASNAKDQFTIGSELERDNANADEFKVWANSNFYNDVTLGSSSVDTITSNGQLTASAGLYLSNCSLEILSGTILVNGQDLLGGGGGGGGSPSITDVQSTGSGASIVSNNIDNVIYLKSISGDFDRINVQNDENDETILINLQPQNYDYSIVVPATASIGNDSNNQSEVFYLNNQGNSNQTYSLISAQSFIKRVIVVKNISTQNDVILQASGSDTIDGAASLTLSPNKSYTLQAIDNSGYRWHVISNSDFNTSIAASTISASSTLDVGGNTTIAGTATIGGNVNLGNDTGDVTTLTGTLKIPLASGVSGHNAGSNKISLNNNNSLIFDDGNMHIHGTASVWLNSVTNGAVQLNMQTSGDVYAGNNFYMNSGYGSNAQAFGVRAWVNFDGTGATGAKTPRGSGNIASVTKNSTGNYTITFTTAMPDGNYCIQATCRNDAAADSDLAINVHYNTTPSTTSFTIQTARYGSGPVDSSYIMVSVIR